MTIPDTVTRETLDLEEVERTNKLLPIGVILNLSPIRHIFSEARAKVRELAGGG